MYTVQPSEKNRFFLIGIPSSIKHRNIDSYMYKVDFMHCPLIVKRKTIDFENELESDKRMTLAEVLFLLITTKQNYFQFNVCF